ncbi:hypothetical protein SEVIR_2G212400v4 [Setaria viridis]|uniref:Uncharacterized protein n=1 Tax=Setaria viridis TaxID=4556 RepID=A0A4U6VWA3_SETVI|nr:microtubule-associated protein futsch-like [Setaria viridis]TKW33113.1 hypothetical protein SEVIR_2G212400v2 [Setaria viridis]
MDAGGGVGGGAGVGATTAGGSSYGLVRTVVGYSTSPLFFWLLTVVLVAAIHIASGSKPSRSDEKERDEKKKARRDGFAAAEEREASGRGDDRVLEMMRSFSFVQATEEDFMEGMAAYEYSRVDAGAEHEQYNRVDAGAEHEQYNGVDAGTAHELVEPEPFAPAPAPSLSFKFQHQIAEIPREAAAVSREIPAQIEAVEEEELQEEKAPSIPLESAGKHEHEDEAEETELLLEEHVEEQRREVVEQAAPSKVVSTTHNYQFLTERDFRGFIREPEAMTVRVQEAFMPPSPTPSPPLPQQHEERRGANIVPRTGGFLTERDFRPADEPDARESVASSGMRTPSRSRKPADEPDVCESVASSGKRTPSWSRKTADEPDACESVASSGKRTPSWSRKTADEPDACESVASSRKRSPPRSRKPASSPSVASKGSAVGARMSFASEFSGFGDSDSESSGSDGYSVKDLVVDSDSDWFLSEKDFPASARNSGNLKSYKAKVLKAMEALEAAAKLEQSYQDSATTVSPGSVCQGSPDTIPDGSPKFPEDMWSRSPSPDVEYKEDEEKVTREAEEQYDEDVEHRSVVEEEGSVDMSDDEHSPKGKKVESAPVYDLAPADNSMDHSEKETITLNDYSGEAISDTQKGPEAVSAKELAAVSSDQVAGPAKRSPEPSEKEFIGLVDHSLEHSSDDRRETSSESGQSYEIVFDDNRRPEPSETEFVGTNDQSHELISDVWKEIISRNDQRSTVAYANEGGLDASEEEFVGRNDRTNEFISNEKKVTFSTINDQSFAVISDEKSIPETPEEQFSLTDHRNGVVHEAKNISETGEDEEQASANDYMDDAARQAYISVTGKAKIYEEEGEDPEVKWKDLTEEEEDELESLWEHQDLIEQLKLELKKVRSIGLPTILEESETPKAPMEDLKPWRIDAKFLREDPMDELNKFYKSYRERMRKFDILCYQKMYAIDFLQLRGPQQSANSLKSLSPTVASILSHNFRPSRRRSPEDPSERFLKELRYDLETVYVGQMCLSWEFLRWQYEQARDLPESDPYHSHQYNQVAGEFQQFQVVVQRFVEDESFKGPRLPNYINNRCVLRNLLQVPVIKEDSLKDRMEDQRKGNYVITSEELEEIMEEAMHILWEFIKADKVETTPTSVIKGLSSTHVELQDPSDHDLMAHIHAALQKKEKRLKDLLRTGNCIVKKFKKPKEDRSNQNLFFSQVDMKLVARVLRMPRITSEQLQWCKAKLDKIILVDRKIHREASFLLFPC